MAFKKIVAVDAVNLTDEAIKRLQALAGVFEAYGADPMNTEETAKRIGGADAVLVSWRTTIDKQVFEKCPGLKYVGLCATSTANIGLEEAEKRGITVTSVKDYGDEATAEFIFSQLLSIARGFGKYQWKEMPCELSGKTLGIVGLGAVGKEVARIGLGFGMKVLYHSRTRKPVLEGKGAKYAELHDLIKSSDIVSLHTPKNLKIFSKQEFGLIPKGTILVNTTLGKAFVEKDFLDWLGKGENLVIMDYSVSPEFYRQFSGLDNVIFSEQIAGRTIESRQRLSMKAVKNLKANAP